jgi:Rieske Fe-S protein
MRMFIKFRRQFLLSLAGKIPGDGSHIFEQTKAIDIENDTTLSVVTGNGKKVTASSVVIATHYPFYDGYGLYFTRLYPERSYIIAVKTKEKFPEGMFITAEDPGRSLRSQEYEGGEMVLVGGEHHKTGQGGNMTNHYINLKSFAEKIYELEDIMFRWSAQDYTTADEVPYTGRLTSNTKNIYVATGFRKWGMTNSTVSAMIIKDMIVNGESPWEELYSPSRLTPGASAKNFVVENANVAKELVASKLSPVPDNFVIAPGRAQIMEINGQKTGVYRDEKGETHLVDTTCTHMRCELKWNSAEKTWDCPCHGSRFTINGAVIDGPAITPLKTVKE